jgi:PAS domain S-box-containing protein
MTVDEHKQSAASSVLLRRLGWSILLVNAFVLGMVAISLQQSHREYEERAEVVLNNLSQMLAQDIGREFEKIDVMLRVAADEIERVQPRGQDSPKLTRFLDNLQGHVPEVLSLRAMDAKGIVRYGRGVDPAAHIDNSDREYFIRQRSDPAAGLVIASPVKARIDKRWVIISSRALRRPDGSFDGVVYCNLEVEHLAKVFSSIDVGQAGSVSLRDTEMRIYARFPIPADADRVYGQPLYVPELRAVIQSGQQATTYVSDHTVDGVERKFAVRKIGGLPLYAVVGRATGEYMQPWRSQAMKLISLALLFSLTTLVAAWQLYRGWRFQMHTTLELAREEEKFHTVADHTYDWEYWEGPDGAILYMSPSCERMTGYSASEFQAEPDLVLRIVHPDDRARLKEHRHDIEHKGDAELDFRILRKDGAIRWIAHVCLAVSGRDGGYQGRRVSNRDITERKQAEASLSQLNAELEQRVAQRTAELETAIYDLENFNYSVSHDLRIPLRAVDNFSALLQQEYGQQLDAEGIRLLQVVRRNTARMAQLIDDMQSFLHAGRMAIVPAEVDVGELVNEVMEEYAPVIDGRDVRLVAGWLPSLQCDRSMLRRILVNLLGNAIKFTLGREHAIIEVGAQAGENETVIFVRDNGAGFDMRYADKLFGVFQRLHGVEEFEGAGIGLAIVKRIVTRMGGRVWAEGRGGEGATVFFSLPAAAAAESAGEAR